MLPPNILLAAAQKPTVCAAAAAGGGDRQNGAAPGPDVGLDDFEALLASVGIPTGPAGAGGEQALVPVGGVGLGGGGGSRMKRYPLASNAVLELLPRPGAPLACRQGRKCGHVAVYPQLYPQLTA